MCMTHPSIIQAMATGYPSRRPQQEWTGSVTLVATVGVDVCLDRVARDATEAGETAQAIIQGAVRGKPGIALENVEVVKTDLDAEVDPKLANLIESSGAPRLWTGSVTAKATCTVDVGFEAEVNDATQAGEEAETLLRRALRGVPAIELDDVTVESTEPDCGCED